MNTLEGPGWFRSLARADRGKHTVRKLIATPRYASGPPQRSAEVTSPSGLRVTGPKRPRG